MINLLSDTLIKTNVLLENKIKNAFGKFLEPNFSSERFEFNLKSSIVLLDTKLFTKKYSRNNVTSKMLNLEREFRHSQTKKQ